MLARRLESLEHSFAKTLVGLTANLPGSLPLPFVRSADGVPLNREIALMLQLKAMTGTGSLITGTIEAARRNALRDARVHGGQPIEVGSVRELTYPGAEGPLPARLYTPPGAEHGAPRPLIVFIHGGGFAICDLDTHDMPCRALCLHADALVLSVEYRLAPEHPFPAGLEDARAAFRFAKREAAAFGADPSRIALAGDSAGAALSAVTSWLAKRDGEALPALQVLIYPTVDATREWPSVEQFAEGLFITRADLRWFRQHYLAGVSDLRDPRVSPLYAPDLAGLPRTIVLTAGFDPLRDEGEAYAKALREAGVPVVFERFADMIHGFINMTAVSPAARRGMERIAALTREQLR